MKTNITLSLDTRRAKKDGTFPLIFRLSHQRKTTAIASGYSIPSSDWNSRNRTVKKSYKGVTSVVRLNNLLSKKKTEYIDQINILEEKDKLNFLSIKELKAHILKTTSKITFYEYTQSLIDEFTTAKRIGMKNNYSSVYRNIKRFYPYDYLRFEEINHQFLKRFEIYHLNKGTSINSLAMYLKTIRAIFNRAIKDDMVSRDAYPFENYKIRMEPTAKRAISREKIKRIMELELKPSNPLFDARNFFLLSYLMNGMSFIDMAYLKRENIIDDRIRYKRQKTGKLYDLKLTQQLSLLLDFYLQDKNPDDYIFPIINKEVIDVERQYRDIKNVLNAYNKKLKEIAKLCKIEDHLTSYVSRHSMATHLILSEVPINALSKMLGHTKLTTTQIYIKELPTNILDDYQERLEL